MKKKRKTSSRRPKPTVKKRSWLSSLIFFLLGIFLALSLLSFFPHLIPNRLQSTIRHSTTLVKQWRQKYWPSIKKPTRQHHPAAGKTTTKTTRAKKPATRTLYITLYKTTPDYDNLKISSVMLKKQKGDNKALARMIFSELSRDTKTSKSPLPPGVRLRSVTFSGKLITLDLSKEIISGLANTGSSDEMLAVYGLVNTYLKNFPAYTEVQIMVEGRRIKTLAGHIEINQPLTFFKWVE